MKSLYTKILILIYVFSFTIHSIPPPRELSQESINKYNQLRKIMAPKSNTIKTLNMNYAPTLNKAPVPRFSWTGPVKLIVIPMQFQDVKFTEINSETTKQNIRQSLFGSDENTLATFYNKSSYGKMTVEELIVTDVVTSARDMSYYGSPGDDSAGGTLPVEALNLAYSIDSNFKDIADNPQNIGNGDNYIHGVEALNMGKTHNDIDRVFLMIIHAGGAEESTGRISDIWSHQWTIKGSTEGHKVGNSTFYGYSTFAEFSTDNGSPVSIACHEFGHQLGASDLYDLRRYNDEMDTGYWSLMDSGVWNGWHAKQPITEWWGSDFDAYHKTLFGWINPVIMNYMPIGDNYISLKTLSNIKDYDDNLIYRYNLNADGSIYYLISVKSNEEYDKYIPFSSIESGLMILKIDENQKNNGDLIYLENGPKQAVTFIRANNNSNIHTFQDGKNENHFYPFDNKDFSPFSVPSSTISIQTTSPLTIKSISRNVNKNIDFVYESSQVGIYNDSNKNTVELIKASIIENPFSVSNYFTLLYMNFNPSDTFEVNIEFMDSQEINVYYTSRLNRLGKSSFFSGDFEFSSFPENTEMKLVAKIYNSANDIVVNTLINQMTKNSPLRVNKVSGLFNLYENKNIVLKSTNLLVSQNITKKKEFRNIETFKLFGECIIEDFDNKNIDSGAFYYLENERWKLLDKPMILKNPTLGIFIDEEKPSIYYERNNIIVSDEYSGLSKIEFYDKDLMFIDNFILKGNKKIIYDYPINTSNVYVYDNSGNKSPMTLKKASLINYNIEIYPNPASNFVNIKFDTNINEDSEFKVYDNSGKIVYKEKLFSPFRNIFWNLSDRRGNKLSNGVYFIKVKTNKGYEIDLKLSVIK